MFGTKEKIVYGAGTWGRALADFLRKKGEMSVACFIDSYRKDAEVDGIPLLKIDQIQDKSMDLCVTFDSPTEEFISDLKNKGFSKTYFLDDIFAESEDFFDSLRPRRFWDVPDNLAILSRNEARISRLRGILKDEKSKNLLDRIVQFRSSLHSKDYIKPEGKQYFPSDVPVFSGINELRFVDAGAFRGDTLKSLYKMASEREIQVASCVCFEPDSGNFPYLISEASQRKSNIFLYPTAVWSKREFLCFKELSNEPTASYVCRSTPSSHENSHVLGVSIDECLYSMRPNFIKMDIEGAELQALEGASKTIKDFRPTLAICLYHTPTDLWEIPLRIYDICDNYGMYLRVHGRFLYETVLYCVPSV